MFHRFFRSRVEGYVVTMEQEALKLVEVLDGARGQEMHAAEGDPE